MSANTMEYQRAVPLFHLPDQVCPVHISGRFARQYQDMVVFFGS